MSAPDPETLSFDDIRMVIVVDRFGRCFNLDESQVIIRPHGTFQQVSDPAAAFARMIRRSEKVSKLMGDSQ